MYKREEKVDCRRERWIERGENRRRGRQIEEGESVLKDERQIDGGERQIESKLKVGIWIKGGRFKEEKVDWRWRSQIEDGEGRLKEGKEG